MTDNAELEALRPQISSTIHNWVSNRTRSTEPILTFSPIQNIFGKQPNTIGEVATELLRSIDEGFYFLQIGHFGQTKLDIIYQAVNLKVKKETFIPRLLASMHDRFWEALGPRAVSELAAAERNLRAQFDLLEVQEGGFVKAPISIGILKADASLSPNDFTPENIADMLLVSNSANLARHAFAPERYLLDCPTLNSMGATINLPNLGAFRME
jgi:hypothetical protein